MITDDERFIKIQGILALSDIHPNDCIKINDLIIDLSKQNQELKELVNGIREERDYLFNKLTFEKKQLQSVIDKAIEYAKEHIRNDDEYPAYMEMLIEEYEELLEILRSKNEI